VAVAETAMTEKDLRKQGYLSNERQRRGKVSFDPERRNKGWRQRPRRAKGEVYLSATLVDLYPFDDCYMERLRGGDWATQNHFAEYFGALLRIKLRSRRLPPDVIGDIRQDTFVRVLVAVRTGEVRQPDRLGAYLNSVCNHVLQEHFRDASRQQHEDVDQVDVPDPGADPEARMIAEEQTESVRATIDQLSEREKAVLWGILLGRDKDEICRELDVDRGYLRVLMHRAMATFRELLEEKMSPDGLGPNGKKKMN